jgi:rubredoxin
MEQMSTPIRCPACGSTLSELDVIIGLAGFDSICDDGSIDFNGQTDIDWDSQKPAGQGTTLYKCCGCGRVFDNLNPLREVAMNMDIVTVMTDYDMTWICPKCGTTTVHDYEALVESGNPICGDCDREMDRYDGDKHGQIVGKPISIKKAAKLKSDKKKVKANKDALINGVVNHLAGDKTY